MRYTIKERELKGLGYVFNNHDYKSYHLVIKEYKYIIWLFVAQKHFYVNDWYQHTYNIIEFYKANRDVEVFLKEDYVGIGLHRETGNIILNRRWEEADEILSEIPIDKDKMVAYKEKYSNIDDYYLDKECMDKLIIEVAKLKPVRE